VIDIEVVVSGHSHVPEIKAVDNVFYMNPGSAGRRCFKLLTALASLDVTPTACNRSFTSSNEEFAFQRMACAAGAPVRHLARSALAPHMQRLDGSKPNCLGR
jgi:hypothetical protein